MKCIKIRHLKKSCGLHRRDIIVSDMCKILDGIIGVCSLGYISSTFWLEITRRQVKQLLTNENV